MIIATERMQQRKSNVIFQVTYTFLKIIDTSRNELKQFVATKRQIL